MGDFRGLIAKLDYLQELGATAIWLLPFYPSPMRDDGYDIADYFDVNPHYGSLADFQAFLGAAHERGLRVITELVINHTSDQNPWFQASRRAAPGSSERELYVWSDSPEKYKDARIIFKDFETSNWSWDPIAKAYYWHRFYSHQPDLNFDNPGSARDGGEGARFLAGHGRRRSAARCHSLSLRARGDELRKPARDARLPEAIACAHGGKIPRPHAPSRGQSVAGRRGQILRRGRRVAHEFPFPAHAADVHGAANGGSFSDHRHPRADAGDSRQTASGRCSCATTTS